ncbi:Uncharacterized protein GBIM_14341 [Gryllus bimaculatus]|nr:Uncharacterized protein GBIM_14341 [Gryllus bimaculatus]
MEHLYSSLQHASPTASIHGLGLPPEYLASRALSDLGAGPVASSAGSAEFAAVFALDAAAAAAAAAHASG